MNHSFSVQRLYFQGVVGDDVIRIIQEYSRKSGFMAEIDELLQNLSTLDEDELEARLGRRAQTIGDDLARGEASAASVDCLDVETAVPRGLLDDALASGQRLFNWINPAAYKLLCTPLGGEGADETMQQLVKLLDEDLEKNVAKATGMLTPFLTANLGLAPAVAALVSTLIIKRASKGVAKFTCEAWQKNLQASDTSEGANPPEVTAST